MPNEQQAKAESANPKASGGPPQLGLTVAPANAVAGSGAKGVIVIGVDPNGPAAEQGLAPGNFILDVGGKAVANASDLRGALVAAEKQGRRDVLLKVKTGKAVKFVAVPLTQNAG